MAYEYRVLKQGRHFPELVDGMIFRDDDPLWVDWMPNDEGPVDLTGLSGVLGIVEATAREAEYDGAKGVRIERREVGPWERVER
jgi:hypothetical protein